MDVCVLECGEEDINVDRVELWCSPLVHVWAETLLTQELEMASQVHRGAFQFSSFQNQKSEWELGNGNHSIIDSLEIWNHRQGSRYIFNFQNFAIFFQGSILVQLI